MLFNTSKISIYVMINYLKKEINKTYTNECLLLYKFLNVKVIKKTWITLIFIWFLREYILKSFDESCGCIIKFAGESSCYMLSSLVAHLNIFLSPLVSHVHILKCFGESRAW